MPLTSKLTGEKPFLPVCTKYVTELVKRSTKPLTDGPESRHRSGFQDGAITCFRTYNVRACAPVSVLNQRGESPFQVNATTCNRL